MRRFSAILAFSLVAIGGYLYWDKLYAYWQRATAGQGALPPAKQTPSFRLSSIVEKQIDSILSPVSLGAPEPLPRQELRRYREQFRDEKLKAIAAKHAAYEIGIQLCGALDRAMTGRESHLLRLADSAAKTNEWRDPKTGALHTNRPFFDNQIQASWSREAQGHRKVIDLLYARLREAERQCNLTIGGSW